MNPFEAPPSGAPVAVDAPTPSDPGPRRGRMALVALLAAGLVGGGIAGVSQLVSADRPELGSAAPDDPSDETVPPVDGTTPPADDDTREGDDVTDERRDGQIVIDLDDEDPVVIELGDLDEAAFDRLHECLGLPAFEFGEWRPGQLPPGALDDFFDDLPIDLDELHGDLAAELGDLGDLGPLGGESVTVAGPDGVSVIDLGENGSVTITKEDGEVTIDTSGDATVKDLDELFGDLGSVFGGAFDDGAFDEGAFDEFLEGLPNVDDLPDFEPIDPGAVRACIDEVLGD